MKPVCMPMRRAVLNEFTRRLCAGEIDFTDYNMADAVDAVHMIIHNGYIPRYKKTNNKNESEDQKNEKVCKKNPPLQRL